MAQKLSDEELHRIGVLAERVILLSRDDLLVHLRFLDAALSKLSLQARPGLGTIASDGSTLYYDPVYVLKAYRQESALLPRTLLHSLLHSVFAYSFGYDKQDRET